VPRSSCGLREDGIPKTLKAAAEANKYLIYAI